MKSLKLALYLGFVSQGIAGNSYDLQPIAHVNGDGIFLDDVVASTNCVVPHVRISAPPRLGQVLTLTRSDIEAATVTAIGTSPTNWSGSHQVSIKRRVRILEGDELNRILTAQLQQEVIKQRGELELRIARSWTPVSVPDVPFTLRIIDLPATGVSSLFVCRFELKTASESIGVWQVSLSASLWREVWTSRTPLRRGMSLVDADLVRERRNVITVRDSLADFEGTDPSIEISEYVAPNVPLLTRSLKMRPTVRRGQSVEARVVEGALAISLKVEVLEDGTPGQTIRIRNPQSKRELRGQVQNESIILVIL